MQWLKGLITVCLLAQAPAASAQDAACRAPLKSMLRVEMFFGRNIGGRVGVTGAKWARFVAHELAPRFPDGLTVVDGGGWWRDPRGRTVANEPSKVVIIVTADNPGIRERIDAASAAYKAKFRQQSVGIVTDTVCAAF
jgi:hypothetical protein